MKLKAFNVETCKVKRFNKPYLSIDTQSGLLRINREFCEKVGLKSGDKISFHQDEETPDDWYIFIGDAKGFEVREKKSIVSGVVFNNSELVRKIAESVAFEGRSGRIYLASEPIDDNKSFWALLTAALQNK